MARFLAMVGEPTQQTKEIASWRLDPVHWPDGCFDEDLRFHRTDPFWRDYVGALTTDELLEFRDQRGYAGRDFDLDHVLASGWRGRILIWAGEWES